jgi:hypothetical protein
MAEMLMFDVAYGLGCNSEDLPILVHLQKLMDAAVYAGNPSSFLVVSCLSSSIKSQNTESEAVSVFLECISDIETCFLLVSWRFLQMLDTTMG